MKLVIKSFNLLVELEENIVDIFVIENPRVMTDVILNTINNAKSDSKILLNRKMMVKIFQALSMNL